MERRMELAQIFFLTSRGSQYKPISPVRGAPDEIVSHLASGRNECTIAFVFEAKKEISVYITEGEGKST
jgi:hypothetical protein